MTARNYLFVKMIPSNLYTVINLQNLSFCNAENSIIHVWPLEIMSGRWRPSTGSVELLRNSATWLTDGRKSIDGTCPLAEYHLAKMAFGWKLLKAVWPTVWKKSIPGHRKTSSWKAHFSRFHEKINSISAFHELELVHVHVNSCYGAWQRIFLSWKPFGLTLFSRMPFGQISFSRTPSDRMPFDRILFGRKPFLNNYQLTKTLLAECHLDDFHVNKTCLTKCQIAENHLAGCQITEYRLVEGLMAANHFTIHEYYFRESQYWLT